MPKTWPCRGGRGNPTQSRWWRCRPCKGAWLNMDAGRAEQAWLASIPKSMERPYNFLDVGMDTENHEPARMSADGTYRFLLTRRTGFGEKAVMFLMLNPSIADAVQNDPTIRRCIGFASQVGLRLAPRRQPLAAAGDRPCRPAPRRSGAGGRSGWRTCRPSGTRPPSRTWWWLPTGPTAEPNSGPNGSWRRSTVTPSSIAWAPPATDIHGIPGTCRRRQSWLCSGQLSSHFGGPGTDESPGSH